MEKDKFLRGATSDVRPTYKALMTDTSSRTATQSQSESRFVKTATILDMLELEKRINRLLNIVEDINEKNKSLEQKVLKLQKIVKLKYEEVFSNLELEGDIK